MTVRVLIRLKPGILDVQGAAVKRALVGLGFEDITELRIGKVIELELPATAVGEVEVRVREMCKKLLVNPVLEDFTIEPLPANNLARRERVQ